MNLSELQRAHRRWLDYNFPDQQPHDALLGAAEELGELARAHLKHQQGIRGYTETKYRDEAGDAIADIIIYLISYSNTNGFNLSWEVSRAWKEIVSRRDWQKDPVHG